MNDLDRTMEALRAKRDAARQLADTAPELLDALRTTAVMLQAACMVITDQEARRMALDAVKHARSVIDKALGQS